MQIDYSLAELLSDSDSELAFVIGHEVGHIIQVLIFRKAITDFI